MDTLIEQCQVAPPPDGAVEFTLPFTYFDHFWLAFHRMRRILFYKLPIAKLDFVQNIIPSLKDSLSLILKHYTPLAGNVSCPLDSSGYPELRYVMDDSVSVTFLETDMDFNYLAGDHPRNAKDFYHFVPQLGEPKDTLGFKSAPVLAIQNLILSRRLSLTHVTFFIVTCAYVWTCLIKSEAAIGEDIDDNFNPPLPPSYFGNCIVGYIARIRHADLAGKEGFTIAVELIRESIQKRMNDEEWILNGSWFRQYTNVDLNRCLSVAGSQKLDLYAADFSWGRPSKLEFVSIDSDNGISMSLGKSKDFDGDLEVGLSLSKTRMNAFAAIFTHGLSFL
ncbi:phenolic glucoside malonyltransferase 1-like [Lycium barbarum]|uniref:phenolic glucoside malonyltransferase 1-like n=1 Tax=Lycium barbarum TaxID=112863 RepID=UPI00293E07C8|nr:phenolic glucoside malonyltransferase 1-like [Lycium barbarum]